MHRQVLTILAAVVLLTCGLAAFAQPAAAHSNELALTASQKIKVGYLREVKRDTQSTLNYWHNKGKWALHRRYKKCWDVPWVTQQQVCYKARASFRKHIASNAYATQRLNVLVGDVGNQSAWLCIHGGEGDWQDGGWTYIGGLQMDWNFVHTYGKDMIRKYGEPRFSHSGPNGWINAWTPREQVIVAERAHDAGRGYYPWPLTARACRLI